jgi:membrane-associated protease RseP (regulator of RpoE activity)
MATDLIWRVEEFRGLIEPSFPVKDVWFDGGRPVFEVRRPPDLRAALAAVRVRLEPLGLLPALRRRRDADLIVLVPAAPPLQARWEVNLLLFLATLATTFYAGYVQAMPLVADGLLPDTVGGALAFSIPLMAILFTHEMGHLAVAISRGIRASLPYFIPMLPPLGTMGAFIFTRSPAPDRDSLMDLGASGPLAGFVVALPILVYGIRHSFVLATVPGPLLSLPDPLLVRWLTTYLLHPTSDAIILGHPTFWAGWFGLLITSLNLLPGVMLDGGHAVRAALGPRRHRIMSYAAVGLALLLGYLPMAVLIFLFISRGHPGPLDDLTPLSRSRLAVGLALIAVFLVSAVPMWSLWRP